MKGLNLQVKSVDSTSALSSGIQSVNSELWNFRAHYDYMRTREPLHQELAETTFTKLVWWSLLEATAPVFSEAKLQKFPDIPFLKDFSEQRHIPTLRTHPPRGPRQHGRSAARNSRLSGRRRRRSRILRPHDGTRLVHPTRTVQAPRRRLYLTDATGRAPEELSALVVMELLYYYALAHQDSFDVRWIKNGTVSDSLVAPMAAKLQNEHGLQVKGGCRVGKITLAPNTDTTKGFLSASSVEYSTMNGGTKTIGDVDGIVLALGSKGMEAVVNASPDLAKLPVFSKAASLKGIDVISARIWLDTVVPTRTPANIFAKYEELRGAGGTFFMLDQFQGNTKELWGGDEPQGSVLACDFYNAGGLMSVSDDDLIQILTDDLLPSAVPQFANAKVVNSWVGKYPGAVSWF